MKKPRQFKLIAESVQELIDEVMQKYNLERDDEDIEFEEVVNALELAKKKMLDINEEVYEPDEPTEEQKERYYSRYGFKTTANKTNVITIKKQKL